MGRFLDGYSGFCNFNYKVASDGTMRIFEINARVGADLACDASWMKPELVCAMFEKLEELGRQREEEEEASKRLKSSSRRSERLCDEEGRTTRRRRREKVGIKFEKVEQGVASQRSRKRKRAVTTTTTSKPMLLRRRRRKRV
eukprot:gnl/TRDRNA2_/TRDRNA2_165618_c0_seq1.p2 gnl/TRDRNA2_/TRDRNA2_165618_c0~~gnl/TRDRNA2_/TRDRNA2_165618_c0_seq1.p2  ORF type:complete len:142 (-),score=19.44 gnl/TRDRNA2_/TRDRNA2_165618_c0_seq1:26-451(-)